MSWLITGTQKVPPTVWDPNFLNVSLLLHGDGTNGSTTITDSSPTPKTVTAVGNVQISTAQSKFGGASVYFDGTGDYLTLPNTTEFNFASGPFTFECWILTTQTKANAAIYTRAPSGYAAGSIVFSINDPLASAGNVSVFMAEYSTTLPILLTSGVVVNDGSWHHLAWTRDATNNHYLFVDGVQRASRLNAIVNVVGTSIVPRIGSDPNNANRNWDGYIDDLRITKGVARYNANFTPPTAPFPDI